MDVTDNHDGPELDCSSTGALCYSILRRFALHCGFKPKYAGQRRRFQDKSPDQKFDFIAHWRHNYDIRCWFFARNLAAVRCVVVTDFRHSNRGSCLDPLPSAKAFTEHELTHDHVVRCHIYFLTLLEQEANLYV